MACIATRSVLYLVKASNLCSLLINKWITCFLAAKRGFLYKKGKVKQEWNRRLFVLSDDSTTLSYFVNEKVDIFFNISLYINF